MTLESLMTELDAILSADVTLAGYVNDFLVGARDAASITTFPTLWIEPVQDNEKESVYPKLENVYSVQVVGLIKNMNADKQIIGDANNIGILKFVNDVKLALDAARTLNGKATFLSIGQTTFSSEFYPTRIFSMNIEIGYTQTKSSRT